MGLEMMKLDNPMRRQVFSLPELIEEQYEDLEPKTRKVMTFQEIYNVQRIILTGCGDSYAACMAMKYAFEMYAGIPVEVVTAIELSRFYNADQLGIDCRNPLVIAVSNSGAVARISEAVRRAGKYGCFILGITSDPDSALGRYCDKILKLDIPPFEGAPGTRSYLVSLMALLLLAIRFGEVRHKYTMDQAMDYRFDIRAQGDLLRDMLAEMDKQCASLAVAWKDLECFDFIGSGFDYAAAWFGHAKILEAVGRYSMHINAEEWFHLNFFLRNTAKTGTVVVGNTTSPGLSRTREVVEFAAELSRPLAVITDGEAEDFGEAEAVWIQVPSSKYPMSMPLTQFVPLCLLAGYLSELVGEAYGRGEKDQWAFCKGGAGVKNSELHIY